MMRMRRILVGVWQGTLLPQRALELLELQGFVRAGPLLEKTKREVLGVLEALNEKILTTSEAEEEIEWILEKQTQTAVPCQI